MKSRETTISRRVLPLLVAQLCWTAPALAQPQITAPPQDPSQFDMTGFIQVATLGSCPASTPAVLCGGTITINDQLIVVPNNTVLQMPAAALTWQEVFAKAPAPWAGTPYSGLAMSDVPAPALTYEAHVVGNRVGDQYIAGLVFLSQHSLQSSEGYINWIDYTNGAFEVGGVLNVAGTGERVKINDPATSTGTGAYGRAWTPDPRFQVDQGNPTVRATTGYPLCFPRTTPSPLPPAIPTSGDDALCPQKNRPRDATQPTGFKTIFTMDPPASTANPSPATDVLLPAPLEVGDYVTYSGVVLSDATGAYVAAYQVIGNLGIFTTPGVDPAYIATDVMLLGVGGVNVAGLTEATARTRFEGFTTDPSRNVLLYAIDVDPCSGLNPAPLRDWGSIDVDQGPPTGAVKGRWRFRPPGKVLTMPSTGTFVPATREMRAAIETFSTAPGTLGSNLPSPHYKNAAGNDIPGTGYYQAPIFEFLFPENGNVGTPIVPNNFEAMPFLAQGSGPWSTGDVVGQLSPWPGAVAPTPANCPVLGLPVAVVGPDQTAFSGVTVTLDGSGSFDTNTPPLAITTYAWTQPAGQAIALDLTNPAKPTFQAPSVTVQTKLFFTLTVSTSAGSSNPVTSTVTVNPTGSADIVSGITATYRTSKSRLIVNANVTPLLTPAQVLTSHQYTDAPISGVGGCTNEIPPAWQMTFGGGGLYTLDVLGVPQPAAVRVTSDHGGFSPCTIVSIRQ